MKQLASAKVPVVVVEELKSQLQDDPVVRKSWKPWTLHPASLGMAALFTAVLAILVGLMLESNNQRGALAIASGPSGFSNGQVFAFRYLPTVVMVLYSISWSWIDLDVRRMEPWFQLSQSTVVSAHNSLLLHYPVDFLPSVPFKAASRR